jgi:hypothetical protein
MADYLPESPRSKQNRRGSLNDNRSWRHSDEQRSAGERGPSFEEGQGLNPTILAT